MNDLANNRERKIRVESKTINLTEMDQKLSEKHTGINQ